MCTAVTFSAKNFYFGRNLDVERSYGEKITVTPRDFPFKFSSGERINSLYAIIGMAVVAENYPLYFDAVNEKGLAMAGLSFAGDTVYRAPEKTCENVAPFEFIPWVLGRFGSVAQVKAALKNINLVNISFGRAFPLTPLHWIIADKSEAVTVESTKNGLFVCDNPVGVLTNRPTFDMQMLNLANYKGLSAKPPENKLCSALELEKYSRGMGAIGLPGDFSSMSRFVRTVFVKMNSVVPESEEDAVMQFFHILKASEQIKGCTVLENGDFEYTSYSSCCNADKGIYYCMTYESSAVVKAELSRENVSGDKIVQYELSGKPKLA